MEKEVGISVGVKDKFGNTNWYRAHSMNLRNNNSMVVFALDDERTPVVVKLKDFGGVCPGIRCAWNGNIHPDILEMK